MDLRENAYLRRQQQRFMRPDAARYLRPDTARCLALERKWDGQPRIEEGEDGAGRFTYGLQYEGTSYDGDRPRVHISINPSEEGLRDAGLGDDNNFWNGLQLAGDLPDGLGGPGQEPPQIPDDKPSKSSQRNAVLRSIASFLGRNSGLIADIFIGLMNEIEWLESYQDLIQAARDPPKTMRELQNSVGKGRPGYDDHHIIEQTAAERWGLSRSQINDRSNIVSIPRLKHYQITGWYMMKNDDFGGLTPREYLSDKSLEKRRQVGLDALELFKVLKR
jgi:hypothetical protein